MTTSKEALEFIQYRRKQIAELRPWRSGDDMSDISVSAEDTKAGSPKAGDMIARNPKNHADQWLVAAAYFADNFEPVAASLQGEDAVRADSTANLISIIAGIREKTGVGGKPMLNELADAIAAEIDRRVADEREKCNTYRNALLWTFDRLSVTGGMNANEQRRTMREIGNVLTGRGSPAATYQPNDWDDSAAAIRSQEAGR